MDIQVHIYVHIHGNIQPYKSLPFATAGVTLEDIILNKTSMTQKREILHDLTYMEFKIGKFIKAESRTVIAWS